MLSKLLSITVVLLQIQSEFLKMMVFGALHTEELCKQPINAEYHCKVKIK